MTESDDEVGPQMPPPKKQKVLSHEILFTNELPNSDQYETSLMHRDIVNYCFVTKSDFLITTSIDGHVKFWKKVEKGVEFVKHFRAHLGLIINADVSRSGRSFATIGIDKYIKVFDVVTFDMINMIKLEYLPNTICWVDKLKQPLALLAWYFSLISSEKEGNLIHIYDGRGGSELLYSVKFHQNPVHLIKYNPVADVVISCDERGMLEYWTPDQDATNGYRAPSTKYVKWEMKSETDLYEFKKQRMKPSMLEFNPDFTKFVTFEFKDRTYRLFNFKTGKIIKKIDESLSDGNNNTFDEMEYGRRLAIEKEIEKGTGQSLTCNAVFDETGNFLIYPTISGIKVINLHTNEIALLLGKNENIRFMNLALYQGAPKRKTLVTVEMAASNNTVIKESEETDPTIFATSFKKNRFYQFTRREPDTSLTAMSRDIFNEKPTREEQVVNVSTIQKIVGQKCIIHTTFGDIYLRLFPEIAPKACENFMQHAKDHYYDNTIWHRCIKGFMIQGGDPEGDGTGGKSIWGEDFEDEFHPNLRHDRPYTVSMANAGPNTNGSQFFITTAQAEWLDDKHTIFGRCTGGMDVIHRIEHAPTDKHDRPEEPIRITSIEMRQNDVSE